MTPDNSYETTNHDGRRHASDRARPQNDQRRPRRGREEVHTRRGGKTSKSLTIVPTDRDTEIERYHLCTWHWQRTADVEKHVVKGRLYHAAITSTKGRTWQYTLDIIELP